MMLTLPVAKCVVISDDKEILNSEKTGKPHVNSNGTILALVLVMPNGKEVRLLIRDCQRGQTQLTLPDES